MSTTVPLSLPTAGRFAGHLVATVLVALGVAGLVPRRRPRERGGFGFTQGVAVGTAEGRRPVVVEFTPHGSTTAVRFRAAAQTPTDQPVPVRYSLADPRNATVPRGDPTGRPARVFFSALALVFGAALFVGLLT